MARLWPPWSSRTWLLLESLAATGVFVCLSLLTRLRRANLCGGSGPSPAKESRGMRLGRARSQHSERSEEHTSELQSLTNLVCRLLLEKKNKALRNRGQQHQ